MPSPRQKVAAYIQNRISLRNTNLMNIEMGWISPPFNVENAHYQLARRHVRAIQEKVNIL